MQLNTVIFDMDGLLIDSEPLWNKAATEIFKLHGIILTEQQYSITTGLRTKEFIDFWFNHFKMPLTNSAIIEQQIIETVRCL